jgi:cytochrome P450
MLSLFTNDVRRNPFPLYERLRREAPAIRDLHTGAWIVLDYDGVKRVLNDTRGAR